MVQAAEAGASAGDLHRLVRRARDLTDPDGSNRQTEADSAKEGLYVTRGLHGSVLGQLELCAEDGDLLYAAIESVLAAETAAGNPVRPVDAAAPTTPVDNPVDAAASSGTPGQRRADALMTLIRAGLEHLEQQHPGRARTELLVLVDYQVLADRAGGTAQTGSGAALTAEQVRRLCCDANLRRIVTDGPSQLLDVGTRTPTFTAAQRAALFARPGLPVPRLRTLLGAPPPPPHPRRRRRSDRHHQRCPVVPPASPHRARGRLDHHRPTRQHLWFQPPDRRPPIASTPPGQLLAA